MRTFPHMENKETSFFPENCTFVWFDIFSDNNLFIRPEDLKASLNERGKISNLAVFKYVLIV